MQKFHIFLFFYAELTKKPIKGGSRKFGHHCKCIKYIVLHCKRFYVHMTYGRTYGKLILGRGNDKYITKPRLGNIHATSKVVGTYIVLHIHIICLFNKSIF